MSLPSSPRKLARPLRAMSYQGAIAALNQLISSKPAPSPPPSPEPAKAALRRLANFHRLFDHIQNLEMEEPLSHLKVIHVAGTKGKGSTCAFTESILRSCGYRTGLFTSPHLLDIRERFRFNGVEVSEAVFAKHFWWCWDRLQASSACLPMPGFFPFLTLLALKMFTAENIDVAILEVGLGGRYDATNIIPSPVVCGITSLGFDHMEVLGNTLAEIAGEKAGIFKAGVPAISVPQQPEAMEVLHEQAKRQGISLDIVPPLDSSALGSLQLGLEGDHQRVNAALAVALCALWEKRCGLNQHFLTAPTKGDIPASYLQGLTATSWPGRAQVIHDTTLRSHALDEQSARNIQKPGSLTFFLDGAHSPESMEACASWFCSAVTREDARNKDGNQEKQWETFTSLRMHCATKNGYSTERLGKTFDTQRVLLFNCMPKRDPQLLLPLLMKTCETKGVPLHMALFVPPFSSTTSIETRSLADIYSCTMKTKADLSWQKVLQQTWESLQGENHPDLNLAQTTRDMELSAEFGILKDQVGGHFVDLSHECTFGPSSAAMSSLPTAVNWLRCWAMCYNVQLQVLVTGSLYLIGDLIKVFEES